MPDEYWDDYAPQTAAKHLILDKYLTTWASILGRGNPPRVLHYVDGFAGRGRHSEQAGGQEGSPLIAMRAAQKLALNPALSPLKLYFVEEDSDNYAQLELEVNKLLAETPDIAKPKMFKGDFATEIGSILKLFRADEPTFVFIDPFGYKAVEMDFIASIAPYRWRELFITFMVKNMNRFLTDPTKAATLDTVLGSRDWRNLIGTDEQEKNLVNLYARELKKRLSTKLPVNITFPLKVHIEGHGAPYYLIHLTHDPKGREVMDKAVRASQSIKGMENAMPQGSLFGDLDCRKGILEVLGKTPDIAVLELAGRLWQSDEYDQMNWMNFRDTVVALERDGTVEIIAGDNRKRKVGSVPNPDKRDRIRVK